MAKFVFSLEGVLRQRKHVEQDRQRALAVKQAVLIDLQSALQRLQLAIQSSNDDVRQNRLIGRLDMNFLAAHRRFLTGMQRQGLGIAQRLAVAQRDVDDARNSLIEAAKQRKAIEKLREKQFDRWRQTQAARELAASDEVGMQLAYENLSKEANSA